MDRQKLLKIMCSMKNTNDCVESNISCSECYKILNQYLDEYDNALKIDIYYKFANKLINYLCEISDNDVLLKNYICNTINMLIEEQEADKFFNTL